MKKPDRDTIMKLTALGDDELWGSVVELAEKAGFRLPRETPPHETLQRLRSTLRGDGSFSLGEAVRILSGYVGEQNGKG